MTDQVNNSEFNDPKLLPVIIELEVSSNTSREMVQEKQKGNRYPHIEFGVKEAGIDLEVDRDYEPVLIEEELEASIFAIRGKLPLTQLGSLRELPQVRNVYRDAPIYPFQTDCDSSTAKGTLSDVAIRLGATRLWHWGVRGQGVAVGICDSGVKADKIPVANGWSPSGADPYGSVSLLDEHGNMVATAVNGIAPDAEIYDIGILKSKCVDIACVLSDALAGFSWAISQFKMTGKPQILTNSWGIYDASTAPDYVRNPNHLFTRQVIRAMKAGITVLFAAGNCGSLCPSKDCGKDSIGSGRSIWGANGHSEVITVGAVNIYNQWVGYSSEGPAALSLLKPDLCGITHYQGYSPVDKGTSSATPICAGVAALLKCRFPLMNHWDIKRTLILSAEDLGPRGWDQRYGYGVVRADRAYEYAASNNVEAAILTLLFDTCC